MGTKLTQIKFSRKSKTASDLDKIREYQDSELNQGNSLRLLCMDYDNPDDVLISLIINGVRHAKVQERSLDQVQTLTTDKTIEIVSMNFHNLD